VQKLLPELFFFQVKLGEMLLNDQWQGKFLKYKGNQDHHECNK
jgi:hypothetical protein